MGVRGGGQGGSKGRGGRGMGLGITQSGARFYRGGGEAYRRVPFGTM